MHDPYTMICRLPFGAILWHKDPEKGGSDDSCGWVYPYCSKKQWSEIQFAASHEAQYPYYLRHRAKQPESLAEAVTLFECLFHYIAKTIGVHITGWQARQWAIGVVYNPMDDLTHMAVFLPGYHSNFQEDRVEDRKYHAERLFLCVAIIILRNKRPWYRHPRWHFWHWRVQL